MKRFAGARWRIPGAILAWVLFTFDFVTMVLSAGVVAGLGGFCASGGPYVIETQCPEAVMVFLPLSFFGIFAAWIIGYVFQGGFSAPVLVWGWPILFVGLGIQFFLMIPMGAVFVGILCGGLFVLMGLAPLIFELRAGPRRIVLGRSDVDDVRFEERPGAPRTFYAFGRDDGSAVRPATAGDWLLSLAVSLGSIGAGVALALWAWWAATGGAA